MRFFRTSGTTLVLAALLLTAACGDDGATGGDAGNGTLTARKFISVTENDAMSLPGQSVPASTDTVTLWLGPGVARRDVGGGSLLVHAAQDRLTWLDHASGTWTSQTGAELRHQLAALAADSLNRGEDRRLDRIRDMLDVAVHVTDTEEEAEIQGYRCRRWLVEQRMGEQLTVSELWLTREIAVDWQLLRSVTQPTLAALPGGANAVAELARLDGFPVRSFAVIQVLGRKGRTETRLLDVATVQVPASHFLPPPGYRPARAPAMADDGDRSH